MLFGSSYTLPRFAYNSRWFCKAISSVYNEQNTEKFISSANIPPPLDEYLLNSDINRSGGSLSLSLSQDTTDQNDANNSQSGDDHVLIIGSQQHKVTHEEGFVVRDSVPDKITNTTNYTTISQDSSVITRSQQLETIKDDNDENYESDDDYISNHGIIKSVSIVKELAAILVQSAIDDKNTDQYIDTDKDDFVAVTIPSPQFRPRAFSEVSKPSKSILKTKKSTSLGLSETNLIQKSAKVSPSLSFTNTLYEYSNANNKVKFDSRIYVGEAVPSSEYERRGDYIARCLTPELAFFIKKELNEVKREMEVHDCSRQNTQFYSV